ncbi:MAG: glycosyltransferase family 39 protein [Pyrinomonadaceae bacterium]
MSNSESLNAEGPAEPNTGGGARHRQAGRWPALIIFAILFGVYGFQLWLHATRASATFDEPIHTLAGYRHWRCGDYGINPEHPPLLKLLAALPISSQNLDDPSSPCGSKTTSKDEGFMAGAKFLSVNGIDRLLIPARLAASLMSLLLAALVFLAAREMFGKPEAFVALALLVFEPSLIAHGSLVTTDMALACTMFAAVYALYRYRRKPSVPRLLLLGLAVGLMLSSKHSGLVGLPVLFLLLIADVLLSRRDGAETKAPAGGGLLRVGAAFAAALLVGVLILWASYGFRYRALPGATGETLSASSLFESNDTNAGKLVGFLSRSRVFPESYVYGLADVLASGERGAYLLGKVYPTGQWFYFPVVFTIKTGIALLLLLPLALLTPGLYRDRKREMLFLLLPSLAYFTLSMTSSLNIGVRHLLPVYPFFIVVAAAGACRLARKHRAFGYALAALLLFHGATAVRTAPNFIAFANDFWGGTNNSYRLLDDSNVDWGQNLKLVNDYVKREGVRECWIAYFGIGELARASQPCHLLPSMGWTMTDRMVEPLTPTMDGVVFLSSSVLPPRTGMYKTITATQPAAVLGGSTFVYRGRFELPVAAAMSYFERTYQHINLKRFDEAVEDGRRAVELAPADPRTHLVLGTALARAGGNDEARRELEEAVRLAETNLALFAPEQEAAQSLLKKLP